MIELKGKYNKAKVFNDNVEETAQAQIIELCNQKAFEGSKIRIMPDVHAGAGCVIGTSMTLTDKIVPNLVGVDIGCGMGMSQLHEKSIDLEKLDKVITENIPSGFNVRGKAHSYAEMFAFEKINCKENVNISRAKLSIGTLGGGNHFIEVNKSRTGVLFLTVHTGSRNLGLQIAKSHQKIALKNCNDNQKYIKQTIESFKKEGKQDKIEEFLKNFKSQKVNKEFAYLEGAFYKEYIKDMEFAQGFAYWNRRAILETIIEKMDLHESSYVDTVHNYIDTNTKILRKGAVSAIKGELLVIPLNMRDGSLLCVGKGNPDWNFTAPHGAGRIMSRTKAKKEINLEAFEKEMKGVYSSSVCESTIDESPMAYKNADEIKKYIEPTVKILEEVKPIYNFKAH